jgi:hypothetical protein
MMPHYAQSVQQQQWAAAAGAGAGVAYAVSPPLYGDDEPYFPSFPSSSSSSSSFRAEPYPVDPRREIDAALARGEGGGRGRGNAQMSLDDAMAELKKVRDVCSCAVTDTRDKEGVGRGLRRLRAVLGGVCPNAPPT